MTSEAIAGSLMSGSTGWAEATVACGTVCTRSLVACMRNAARSPEKRVLKREASKAVGRSCLGPLRMVVVAVEEGTACPLIASAENE